MKNQNNGMKQNGLVKYRHRDMQTHSANIQY